MAGVKMSVLVTKEEFLRLKDQDISVLYKRMCHWVDKSTEHDSCFLFELCKEGLTNQFWGDCQETIPIKFISWKNLEPKLKLQFMKAYLEWLVSEVECLKY